MVLSKCYTCHYHQLGLWAIRINFWSFSFLICETGDIQMFTSSLLGCKDREHALGVGTESLLTKCWLSSLERARSVLHLEVLPCNCFIGRIPAGRNFISFFNFTLFLSPFCLISLLHPRKLFWKDSTIFWSHSRIRDGLSFRCQKLQNFSLI